MIEQQWRSPTAYELGPPRRLLQEDLPGRDALRIQLETARVRQVDERGSLQFEVTSPVRATEAERVPVNGRFIDDDGEPIDLLLYVTDDGRLWELQIYKLNGSPILARPIPSRLTIY